MFCMCCLPYGENTSSGQELFFFLHQLRFPHNNKLVTESIPYLLPLNDI